MRKLNRLGIIAICLIILSVLTTTVTFSWFTRPGNTPVRGNAMNLEFNAVVKSYDVTAETYLATLDTGNIVPAKSQVSTSEEITIDANKVQYFRTVVKNNENSKNNIYLGGLELSNGSSLTVNCMSPLHTTSDYTSGMAITKHMTVDAGGTLNVDWYIYNKGESAVTVKMTKLPQILCYN